MPSGRRQPASVGDEWQGVLSSLKDERGRMSPRMPARLLAEARLAPGRQWRAGSSRLMATGARSKATIATKARKRAAPNGLALTGEEVLRATRDFRSRHHDDPCLTAIARPPSRRSRPARMAEEKETTTTSSFSPEAMASRKPITNRPIFIDHVAGPRNSRPCPRCSTSCGGPIVRRSVSNSCTSPTRRRRAGSRSASRGPTRPSNSLAARQDRHPCRS